MNQQEAKKILSLYRPGTADAEDESFAEALRFCESDPALKSWFDGHCALYAALRLKFKETPVPEGLKEQILAERRVATMSLLGKKRTVFAVVAVVAVLTGLLSLWLRPREDTGYTGYANRMVSAALRGYSMDLTTNDLGQIRAFLAQTGSPSDYAVPTGLQLKAAALGCALETWQGARVSLICFKSGKSLRQGQTNDLWLFVTDSKSVRGAPEGGPVIRKVNRTMTASWTEGGLTYLLVADGDAAFLQQYL